MIIKNNGPSEPLLPRNDAPPLQPNGEDRASAEPRPRKMLNEKQVLEIVPFGRTTLYHMERDGKFPRSIYISPNRRCWFADDIVRWQNTVNEFNPLRGRGKGRRPRS
jgi:prophage regulatory protein